VLLFGGYDKAHHYVKILPFYAGILGVLMVSKIKYQHVGKWLGSIRRNRKRQFFLVSVAILFLLSPSIVAVGLINGYVIWGVIKYIITYKDKY